MYVSTDDQESSKLIGMLTGEGRALIFSSLFHLLQGTMHYVIIVSSFIDPFPNSPTLFKQSFDIIFDG